MSNSKWSLDNIPKFNDGKVAIVTGANSGLGYETTKALADKNIEVVMASRNRSKVESAIKDIRSEVPTAKLKFIELDLNSLDSVREFANNFKQRYHTLDYLVNNAGLMMPPYGKTEDGFEQQFGVNYLGHFLLTGLLLETLKKSSSRVVTISSMAHKWGDIYFDDINFEDNYDKRKSYGQSKLACLIFAYELQRRVDTKDLPIKSFAAHPGISSTNLVRFMPWFMSALSPLLSQNQFKGALPQIRACLDTEIPGGSYLGPNGFNEMWGAPVVVDSSEASKDEDKARKLWEVSENLTGFSFLD